ncbi:S-layer homology domain-containing protein [Flintibacter sp. KGMB00164]|uniref:S-layer homology domain-containing protein n=1 Tax=Flintibacter sp. KGMB00164 TaxID=2610895 RepID=UPI0012450F53|nr:S-layer homology domain-containing protein [Flintibacter sp. KGMB00164]
MRNLKRALSLLLSSTMVLGMLVMGSSAAGYQDVDASNDNQEAIEVLQKVGIMTGDENGNFNPDGSITRNEMAVVMAHLLNLDYDYYRGTNPFTDVPEWAAPYVAACAAEGVVTGIGNGQYGGDQKVTAAQAALMIMKALGYFQNAEDFGTDWQVATIRQASYINLFDKIDSNAESALTRGQVAQLVLNGLKAKMVDFTGDKGIQIGDVTVGYRAEYTAKTGTDKKYNTLVSGKTDISEQGQYYIQLGEELYDGKLTATPSTDDFERPATTWVYDKKEIGTYVNWDLMVEEYTTAITGKDLSEVLTKTAIEENYVNYYVDGKENPTIKAENMIKSNTKTYNTTGNGVLTQVFFDKDDEQITITSINTYLAKADADYDADDEELLVDIYADPTSHEEGADAEVTLDEVAGIEKYKEDDMMLVNVAWDGADYNIVAVSDVTSMVNVDLSKYSVNSYVVSDGTQYNYALNGKLSDSLNEITTYGTGALTQYTYTLYLDQYGYLIGNEVYEGDANYLFMTGYDLTGSNLANKTADANVIFLDGTMSTVKVDKDKTNSAIGTTAWYKTLRTGGESEYNKWFTYVTEEKNGETVYTLTPVDNWMNSTYASNGTVNSYDFRAQANGLNSSSVTWNSYVWGNDDSTYITVEAGVVSDTTYNGITKVLATYTGVEDINLDVLSAGSNGLLGTNYANNAVDNGPNTVYTSTKEDSSIYAVVDDDNYVIGAVILGEDTTSTNKYAYVLEDTQNEWKDSEDNVYWEFTAIVDGKVETLTMKSPKSGYAALQARIAAQLGTDDINENGMMKLTYDKDGYVIDAYVVSDAITNGKLYDNADFGVLMNPDNYNVYSMRWVTGGVNVNEASFNISGRTLYGQWNDRGIRINTDAPVYVVWEETYTGGETPAVVYKSYKDLDTAIKALSNAGTFDGWVSAVLADNGNAEYIVIKSADPVSVTTDGGDSKDPVSNISSVTLNSTGTTITVRDNNGTAIALGDLKDVSWKLEMRAPGQASFDVALDGNDYTTEKAGILTFISSVGGNTGDTYSFRVTLDGVVSNTITIIVP